LSAKEWEELDASVPEVELPLTLEMVPSAEERTSLKIVRLPGFNEPWVCSFGAPYDSDRRVVVTSLLVKPERWAGALPE
jgi:hypothetical protein